MYGEEGRLPSATRVGADCRHKKIREFMISSHLKEPHNVMLNYQREIPTQINL